MFKKLSKMFFEEIEEEEDEPFINPIGSQQPEDRVFNFTIAKEPEEAIDNTTETRPLYRVVVEQQEITPVTKKNVILSPVISPMYGVVTSPIIVTTDSLPGPSVTPIVANSPLHTVTSPYGSSIPPENKPVYRPAAETMALPTNQTVNNTVNNPTTTPSAVVQPVQQPVAPIYQAPQQVLPSQAPRQSYNPPSANSQPASIPTQQAPVTSNYERPLDTNLFGESINANFENGSMVETQRLPLPDVNEFNLEEPRALKRRSKKPKVETTGTTDSLFDDFDANFATKELARLMEEQDTDELAFKKFDLFDGE